MTVVKEKIIDPSEITQEIVEEKKIDAQGRAYATGKRKDAIARVWIKKGNGKITTNGHDAQEYLGREILVNIAKAPFTVVNGKNKFDVIATLSGGGLSGQAGALAHGISKALVAYDPQNRKVLRPDGFLTRDSRVVERKKPGLKKARKGQTYRKR